MAAQKFVIKKIFPVYAEYYSGNGTFTTDLLYVSYYDTYPEAETVIKFLPPGIYQIDKLFSVAKQIGE